jgi:2-polyprenyl-6-hydroxyphenyl methylase/3-demethylubiquinone-9 3-methyltransferase
MRVVPLGSYLRRARAKARTLALRTGLLRYSSEPWSPEFSHWAYTSGHLDYFAGIEELPRYSLLIGYLIFLGGEPEILDVGCGQGLLRARIGHLPFRRYLGIDVTPAAIAKASKLEDSRTSFAEADVCNGAAVFGQFDVVVCNEVLSVAPDPEAVLSRIATLLRRGGHLLTSTWRHPGDEQLLRLIDRRFTLVDAVEAQNPANPIARRGWRVTCHCHHGVSHARSGRVTRL